MLCSLTEIALFRNRLYFGIMSFYGFLRLGVVPLAMIGWVLYQLFAKKKEFKEIQGDFFAVLFMVVVYSALLYWITT